MLCKVEFCGKNSVGPLDEYCVEGEDIHDIAKKAQATAELEYKDEKPITITKVRVIYMGNIIR